MAKRSALDWVFIFGGVIALVIISIFAFPGIWFATALMADSYLFHHTKPNGKVILENYFPYSLTNRGFHFINAERVKFIREDKIWGAGHIQEGGACAIVTILPLERVDQIKADILGKFALLEYDSPGSISLAQTYKAPSSAVCNFMDKSNWHKADYQILASSSTCELDCTDAGEFQEYSAFYNRKLNQILIEWLDYDGDHANSFP